LEVRSPLPPNQTAEASVLLQTNPLTHSQPTTPINGLHVAIRNNVGIFYFQTLFPFHILFREDGLIPQNEYLRGWKEVPEAQQHTTSVDGLNGVSAETIKYVWSNGGEPDVQRLTRRLQAETRL
jgi:AP-1 complex subunit beta-1